MIVLHVNYEKLAFSAFNFQYLKNIVFDVFLFINYEDLRKSTIPSTVYVVVVVVGKGHASENTTASQTWFGQPLFHEQE